MRSGNTCETPKTTIFRMLSARGSVQARVSRRRGRDWFLLIDSSLSKGIRAYRVLSTVKTRDDSPRGDAALSTDPMAVLEVKMHARLPLRNRLEYAWLRNFAGREILITVETRKRRRTCGNNSFPRGFSPAEISCGFNYTLVYIYRSRSQNLCPARDPDVFIDQTMPWESQVKLFYSRLRAFWGRPRGVVAPMWY